MITKEDINFNALKLTYGGIKRFEKSTELKFKDVIADLQKNAEDTIIPDINIFAEVLIAALESKYKDDESVKNIVDDMGFSEIAQTASDVIMRSLGSEDMLPDPPASKNPNPKVTKSGGKSK